MENQSQTQCGRSELEHRANPGRSTDGKMTSFNKCSSMRSEEKYDINGSRFSDGHVQILGVVINDAVGRISTTCNVRHERILKVVDVC